MELKLTGKYAKFYEKHSDTVINLFCDDLKCSEISNRIEKEFGVKIPFQSLVHFYCNNKNYIENCKKKKREFKKDEIKEKVAIDYCKEKGTEFLFLLTEDLPEKVKSLTYEQQLKLITPLLNALAKLEGQDKSEFNITNGINFEEFFDDEVIEDALDDYESSDEGSD